MRGKRALAKHPKARRIDPDFFPKLASQSILVGLLSLDMAPDHVPQSGADPRSRSCSTTALSRPLQIAMGTGERIERLIAFPLPCLGSLGGPILIIFAAAFPPWPHQRLSRRRLCRTAACGGGADARDREPAHHRRGAASGPRSRLGSPSKQPCNERRAGVSRLPSRSAPPGAAASPRTQDHLEVRRADAAAPAVGVGAFARLRLDRPSPGQGSPPAAFAATARGKKGSTSSAFLGALKRRRLRLGLAASTNAAAAH